MNISIGFIILFVFVVIPGFIFKRFYYFGEFSKQFTAKQPILKALIYSIIPGILIQLTCFFLYLYFINNSIKISQVINILRDVYSDDGVLSTSTSDFFDNKSLHIFYYTLSVYITSVLFGYFFSRIIRSFGWDKTTKIFRYKNQWYYIFSGEVLHFNKFKKAAKILNSPNLDDKKIDMVYADILIKSNENESNLYTGFVADYDLDSEDVGKLDKVYLVEAKRFKKIKLNKSYSNEAEPYKVEKKPIEGSVFIVPVKDLININLLYVTSSKEEVVNSKALLVKKILYSLLFLVSLFFSFASLFKYSFIEFNFYNVYFINTNFFDRLIALLCIMQLIGTIFPSWNKDKKKFQFLELGKKILVFLFFLGLFIIINWSWLF